VRPDHTYGDVKDILETWRLRLPNEWDPLLHWQDVLVWRNTVYNVVISVSSKLLVVFCFFFGFFAGFLRSAPGGNGEPGQRCPHPYTPPPHSFRPSHPYPKQPPPPPNPKP
jgi:hypothetical protein